jgi:hypothetical protein
MGKWGLACDGARARLLQTGRGHEDAPAKGTGVRDTSAVNVVGAARASTRY